MIDLSSGYSCLIPFQNSANVIRHFAICILMRYRKLWLHWQSRAAVAIPYWVCDFNTNLTWIAHCIHIWSSHHKHKNMKCEELWIWIIAVITNQFLLYQLQRQFIFPIVSSLFCLKFTKEKSVFKWKLLLIGILYDAFIDD